MAHLSPLQELVFMLQNAHRMEGFFQQVTSNDPGTIVRDFKDIDYRGLKENLDMFLRCSMSSAIPGDDYRHATESPLVAQVINYLEKRFTNRSTSTNAMIIIVSWLTFCLERTLSRLKKIGGPSGEEALEELRERRANSGCPQVSAQLVESDVEKRMREEVDQLTRFCEDKVAEMGGVVELQKRNEWLEEENAMLKERIATLEKENGASVQMKQKFIQKIKELNKKDIAMKERVRVLEMEKDVCEKTSEAFLANLEADKAKDKMIELLQEQKASLEKHTEKYDDALDRIEERHLLLGQVVEKERKEHAETIAEFKKKARENHIVKTFLEVKNRSLEHMKTEHEKERKMMQKYREDMIRLVDRKHQAVENMRREHEAEREMMKKQREDMHRLLDQRNQALEECHKEKMKMIEDFHLEVKLIDILQSFFEKFDSLEPKDYRTELFASLGKLKPDITDFESPDWIELESQLLVPFLMGKELARKKKAEGEDLYNQIGDHFALLGLHIDP